jgi:hypothetical protein
MMINPKYAQPILTLANALSEHSIPCSINILWDGLQIQFPWNDGDLVCNGGSYGSAVGDVESIACPWDEDDVTRLTIDEAFEKISKWYRERGK